MKIISFIVVLIEITKADVCKTEANRECIFPFAYAVYNKNENNYGIATEYYGCVNERGRGVWCPTSIETLTNRATNITIKAYVVGRNDWGLCSRGCIKHGDGVWVGKRCKGNDENNRGQFEPPTLKYDTYCCPLSDNKCDPDNMCPKKTGTFYEITKECEERGLRLCTREEFQSRTCCEDDCQSPGYWTSTFENDYNSTFWLSKIGTQCSDTKSDKVTDKLECRIAFADLLVHMTRELGILPWKIEYNISDPFYSPNHPTGCIAVEILERGKEISVRWNESPSGQSSSSAYQVCKTDETDANECTIDTDCNEREVCEDRKCQEFKLSDCKGDIGFLIDGSSSIVDGSRYLTSSGKDFEYYWNVILDFIIVLAKTIGISENGARMAVVVFSNEAKLEIKFSDHKDYDSFKKAVLAIKHPDMGTNTLEGFKVALSEMFSESTGMRPDEIPKNLIYLTDGACSKIPEWDCSEERFKEFGIRFEERRIRKIGIGIGPAINESEIVSFVGKESFFKEDNFYKIMSKKFRSSLSICDECPYKFTKAQGLYCDKDCGANWLDNEHGCQAADADAFCRMKFCRKDVYAKSYTITDASNKNGFSCAGVGTRFSRKYQKYQGFDEVYFTDDIRSSHGVGNIVTNIVCDNITNDCIWNEWKANKCSTTCGTGVRRLRRTIRIPANFIAGGKCNNVTEKEETCKNIPCKPEECFNGDVRITREKFPQIYWNHKWNKICYIRFTKNENGVNLFCQKLLRSINYPNKLKDQEVYGKLLAMEGSKKYHSEATFLVGNCKKNDSWPTCTGGCNSLDLGGRCYLSDSTQNNYKYYSCRAGEGVKFLVQCSGQYDLPIASCPDTKTKRPTTQRTSLSGLSSTQGKTKTAPAKGSRDVQKIYMRMGADKKSSSIVICVSYLVVRLILHGF